MQSDKKYIRYKGITRLPSDHDSFDGELEESINMSLTGGELRPVLPPALIGTIPGMLVFVHKNMGYEHFLSLDGNTIKAYKYVSGAYTLIGNVASVLGSSYNDISAVGNTVIITTSQDVIYSLWKQSSNSYASLGSDIPFPVLNFSMQGVTISDTDKSFSINASDTGQLSYLNFIKSAEGTFVESSQRDIDMSDITDFALKPIVKILGDRLGEEGTAAIRSKLDGAIGEAQSLITGKVYAIINTYVNEQHEQGRHIFPFFVRYALRMFDGSLVKHSPPLLMLPSRFIPFRAGPTTIVPAVADGPENNKKISIIFNFPSELEYSHASSAIASFSDIVQSVDVFITPPIYTYDQQGVLNGRVTDADNPSIYLFGDMFKSRDNTRKMIAEASNFYLVDSIPVSDLATSRTRVDVKMEKLNTLLSQIPMEDDYLSHDKIKANSAFAYNHKLHLLGVSTKPFGGFKYTTGTQAYEISDYGIVGNNNSFYFGSQPYMYYPSVRAKEAITYTTNVASGAQTIRLPLTEHKYLNGAFYLNPNLLPPTTGSVEDNFQTAFHFENRKSTLYVSSPQNPFVFPAASRVTLPVGEILAVSSNTEAISQGQFGQFPLYAFTDDGIWALEINAEGKYVARQPVSRDVIINNKIMQMDKALAFVTGKGVTLLSGVDTNPISEIIRENNIRNSKVGISGVLSGMVTAQLITEAKASILATTYQTDVTFETFAQGATLAFDYITAGGRIFVINPQYSYAYVFDLATATWAKIIASYKRVVTNYPDCYVQDGDGKVFNLAHIPQAVDTTTTCMILTRPITYNDLNFVIKSLAHRGIYRTTINVVIYASRNGVDYSPVMHRRDRIIRMHGSGYKYYKLLIIADMASNEAISGIEIDLSSKYENRMR